MATLLTQHQTDALRSIGDSALVLFAMAMIDGNYPGRATRPDELLPYLHPTYKDRRKLIVQMDALSASGRLAKQGAGYVLLEGGRALVLSMSPEPMNALAQSPALSAGTQDQALVIDVGSVDFQGEHVARALRALKKEEEDSLILETKESFSSDIAQNARTDALEIAPGVTTERILLATGMLDGFGEDGVFLHGLDLTAIHPREALGWIAQAYHQRSKLGSPAGLVYSRLRDTDQPKARSKYREGWESFLPEAYLRQIGWLSLVCDCGQEFSKLEDLEAHRTMLMTCEYGCGAKFHSRAELDEHHKTHEASSKTFSALAETDRGGRAWQVVRDELALTLPKASFDTWVRDAQPVAFGDQTLTVAVRNAYAADWLSSRLGDKVRAMLKKITHEEIQVAFVVGSVQSESEQ